MNQSPGTVRLVIVALAVIAETVLVGCLMLVYAGKAIPGELIAIPIAAVGAIGAILSSTHFGPSSSPVTVTNTPANPVQVEQTNP